MDVFISLLSNANYGLHPTVLDLVMVVGDYCVKLRVTWIQRDFLQVPVELEVISPKSRLNLE